MFYLMMPNTDTDTVSTIPTTTHFPNVTRIRRINKIMKIKTWSEMEHRIRSRKRDTVSKRIYKKNQFMRDALMKLSNQKKVAFLKVMGGQEEVEEVEENTVIHSQPCEKKTVKMQNTSSI